jgi:hypothetical protein
VTFSMKRRRRADRIEITPLIDIGRALDLLAAALDQRGENFRYRPVSLSDPTWPRVAAEGPRSLVGRALSLAQVGDGDLEALRDHGLRQLYKQGSLPVRFTLGAVAVLDAAQGSKDRGNTSSDALEYATSVAVRFLELVPDAAFDADTSDGVTAAETCRRGRGRRAALGRDARGNTP